MYTLAKSTKGTKRKEGGGTLIVPLVLEGVELQNEQNTFFLQNVK